jgi:hypothetical protein
VIPPLAARRLFVCCSTRLGTYGFRGGKGSAIGFGGELGEHFPDRPQRGGERALLSGELIAGVADQPRGFRRQSA